MDKIFKWFTLSDANTLPYIVWFVKEFPNTVFEKEYRILYEFLVYCSRLGITAQRSYLESFLATECKHLIKEDNIKIDFDQPYDYSQPAQLEEANSIIIASVLATFDLLVQQDLTGKEFKVDVYDFIKTQNKSSLINLLGKNYSDISSNSKDISDVTDVIASGCGELSRIFDPKKIEKLDFMLGLKGSGTNSKEMTHLFNFGIPMLDESTGGGFTTQMFTFSGPSGSGKSRFAMIQCAYNAAVRYRRGVLINELELSEFEVESMLVSHHIANLHRIKIPDSEIIKGRIDETQRMYVEEARMDLFESGKYGRIIIQTDDLVVGEIEKDLVNFFKVNQDIKVWVVDYLGIVSGGYAYRNKDNYQVIRDALIAIKNVVKKTDRFAFVVSQFNAEGVAASLAGKPIEQGMVEGGQIIQRHTDYDFAMHMTAEQKQANVRMLSTIKERAAVGFSNLMLATDLSCSLFEQK